MATYTELNTFMSAPERAALSTRVMSAINIKASTIAKAAGAAAPAKAWAKEALDNLSTYYQSIFTYVVYDSAALTIAQIAALTDSEVQTKVDKIVDSLYS